MSLKDFWISVKVAAGAITPRATVDSSKLDPDSIEQILRGTTSWMTRGAVAGFAEKDFVFLPDADRERLAKLVADFLQVVSPIDPRSPVPDEAVERARPIFQKIIQILEFDRYGDPNAYRSGKAIEREFQPEIYPEIADIRFDTGVDHSGKKVIWIWVFLTEEASESDERFLGHARKIRETLDSVARRTVPGRWPYLAFRSIAEKVEPAEVS